MNIEAVLFLLAIAVFIGGALYLANGILSNK